MAEPAAPDRPAEDAVRHVRTLFEAYEREGTAGFVRGLPEDVRWTTYGNSEPIVGLEAVKRDISASERRGERVQIRAYGFEAVGACVLVHGTLRRTSAAGEIFESQLYWVLEVREGRLVHGFSASTRAAALAAARERG